MPVEFYSPKGLRDIALWLDELIDKRRQTTQQAIADCAGVSPSTIGNLRLHRKNLDSLVSRKPDPDFLLNLAVCIPDPTTGQPFADPWRLMRIATGFEDLHQTLPKKTVKSQPIPYPAFVQELVNGIDRLTIDEFAKISGIKISRLNEILTSSDPGKALPTWAELSGLAKALNPNPKNSKAIAEVIMRLAALCGYGNRNTNGAHPTTV